MSEAPPSRIRVLTSARETIFQMRHHVQLTLGDLAKLSALGNVTPTARAAIEQRLWTAMRLADAFEEGRSAAVLQGPRPEGQTEP